MLGTNYFSNTSTVNISINTNLVLDAYRILVLTSDNPLTNLTFAWDQEDNGSYTWFSWRQTNINARERIALGTGQQAAALSGSPFPLPTSDTIGGTLTPSSYSVNISDPTISMFAGDLYCLLKVQSYISGRLLNLVKAKPSATITQTASTYGSGSALYNNAASAVYFRGNGGVYTGNFSNTFIQSDSLGTFGLTDDVGQVLIKLPGISANQTQANLDFVGKFQLNINC